MSTSTKYKVAFLAAALLLVCSLLPLSPPATPALADVTVVTITSPTTTSPGYAKTGGTVNVQFDVSSDNLSQTIDILIEVLDGSTTVASTQANNVAIDTSPKSFTYPVVLTGVASGTYDLKVSVRQPTGSGTWMSDTKAGAIIVDNTAPSVTLIQPNGGEYVHSNQDYTIKWNATDAIPAGQNLFVTAEYSVDGGTSWNNTNITNVPKPQGIGEEAWTAASIPNVDTQTAKIRLTVKDAAGNQIQVTSAGNFTILNTLPTVTISIPTASTVWDGGSSQQITFTTTSAFNLNVDYKLEFYNGSTWTTITPGTDGWVLNQPPGLTHYNWTVPNNYAGSAAKIRATVRDKVGRTAIHAGDSFTIRDVTAPTVTITKPKLGDKVYNGIGTQIKWTASDNVAGNLTYTWYLSTDGGSSWQLLNSTTESQGTLTKDWTPSVTETKTNCKIKVTAKDAANNTGEAISDTFTIIYGTGVNPTVTLLSPNGGENWQGGTCKVIRWSATDPADPTGTLNYTLQYSADGGSSWNDIVTLNDREQGEHTFCWAVPLTAGTNYKVKATATSPGGGSASDESDANFTVAAAEAGVNIYTVNLKTGWNLVSLQAMPVCCPSTSTSCAACAYPIESVLADALDSIQSVWYWTGGSTGTWLSYAPGAPSTLTTMTDGKAYWVYASADDSFSYLGRKGPGGGGFPTTPYSYVPGWNMVGFKSTINKTVQEYLGGVCGGASPTYVTPIYCWDETSQVWCSPSPGCSDNMTPTKGYWVYFNTAHTVNAGAD